MKNKILSHYRLISFICGWLSVTALPPFNIFPLLFISIPLLLWIITNAPKRSQAFKSGYYFGFSFFAFGLAWINQALLIDAQSFGWLIPIVFISSGLFFGLFIAIPSLLSWLAQKIVSPYISFAVFVSLGEWIRSFFLTGFPWNLFGSCFSFSLPLMQFASIGGTYLLSLLLILSVSAPIFITSKKLSQKMLSVIIPTIILSTMYFFGVDRIKMYPYTPSTTSIRLVQPAIPQTLKWNSASLNDNLNKHIKMSQFPGQDNIDFIIWGETAFPFALEYDTYQRQKLQYATPKNGWLITGALRYSLSNNQVRHAYNSLFVINPQSEIVDFYDKSHLVPFGEYIPFRDFLPKWIRPITSAIGTFQAGSGPKVITLKDQPSFGGMICYETIFPHQIIDSNHKPQWLINITNDGWYGNSSGPYQHLVATRLRSIEEGISIARVAGSGISALISPTGQIIGSIPLHQSGTLDLNLPQESAILTIYNKFGNNIFFATCAILIIISVLTALIKSYTKKIKAYK
ncbi:MAG: apolipoprotein N-acyltransferase [Alphaproteobacteria bacterium]|nr:apolipoprotein N-acyltransferase [Alphaproteobacteria bacterium]